MDNNTPIFRTLAMIEERILEKLTAEKLAESIHFSKYHYQRLFRETVGDSVMRYVTRRRLTLAAEELAQTDASVLDIGLKYGYESHEGFSRSFKAFLGVTPMEYRKYHFAVGSPVMPKERCVMMYSKTTDEIIREMNGLIVQTRETAEYTKKEGAGKGTAFYASFWECIASRAEAMAEELSRTMDCVTAIARQPDEITVRFAIIKAMEDATFQAHIMVFQIKLMFSRAKPEHRKAYDSLCEKYNILAHNAGIKTEKITAFFNELATLIFRDMRKDARQALEKTVERGRVAVGILEVDPALPYGYIADELAAITDEISALTLEEITVRRLEDCLLRLDIIAFAADMDVLRAPIHEPLFRGIADFKEQMTQAMTLFQSLARDASQASAELEENAGFKRKKYSDLVLQESILLFYLKGEIQKLGQHLSREQKAALDAVCNDLDRAIGLAKQAAGEEEAGEIAGILGHVCDRMKSLAEDLGIYGAPLRFLAEEVNGPVKYL